MNFIKVQIGESEKYLKDVTPDWIEAQIRNRREDEASYCVRISFNTEYSNMILSTRNCPPSGGRTMELNNKERRIYELWKSCGLNKDSFEERNLISFLNQLK